MLRVCDKCGARQHCDRALPWTLDRARNTLAFRRVSMSIAVADVLCRRAIKLTRSHSPRKLSTTITAPQFEASLPSHCAFGKQNSSHGTEQISHLYLNAFMNASQHRRACKIVFIRYRASFYSEKSHYDSNLSRACSPIFVGKLC